jgi:hypothetical protein
VRGLDAGESGTGKFLGKTDAAPEGRINALLTFRFFRPASACVERLRSPVRMASPCEAFVDGLAAPGFTGQEKQQKKRFYLVSFLERW